MIGLLLVYTRLLGIPHTDPCLPRAQVVIRLTLQEVKRGSENVLVVCEPLTSLCFSFHFKA